MNSIEAEGIYHEAEILLIMRALEVFGDSETAGRWMREPNPALANKTPLTVIQTPEGLGEVRNILGRIEHGVIS